MFTSQEIIAMHPRDKGVYFGYPPCCIDAFLQCESVDSAFDGTGFKTCKKCSERPYLEVLEEINSRRKHHERFPYFTYKLVGTRITNEV